MHKERLDFKQKILVLLAFLAMGCIVVWQARFAYQADISQQKERARLNARIYAEELQSDFEAGMNITLSFLKNSYSIFRTPDLSRSF